MGLRELLGLPPKPPKKKAAEAPAKQDPDAYEDAKAQYDKLIKHPQFDKLPKGARAKLDAAREEASGLQAHEKYEVAAKRLRDAVAEAAKTLVQVGTAAKDMKAARTRVSGLLDGARLLGVPKKHIEALKARHDKIVLDADEDIIGAALAMQQMASDLAKDPQILAAKAARDRVLSDQTKVEAAAAKALKVPTETPEVLKLNRLLANAVPLIGFHAGKTNFVEALRHLENCEKWVAAIAAQAADLKVSIKLRDQILARRKKIDGDVTNARAVFGMDKESEALVERFQRIDKAFEGAMYVRDYKVASTYLDTLESLAKQVAALKPQIDARLKLAAESKKLFGELKAGWNIIRSTRDVTSDMEKAYAAAKEKYIQFIDLINEYKHEEANALGPEVSAAFETHGKAAAAARAELDKIKQANDLWDAKGKARYIKALKLNPCLPEMSEAIAKMKASLKTHDKKTDAKDYDGALKDLQEVINQLDIIDGLVKKDSQAKQDRSAARKEFKKGTKDFDAVLAIKANTPEMFSKTEKFRREYDDIRAAMRIGEAGTADRIKKLIAEAKEIQKGKAENAKQAAAASRAYEEKAKAGEAAFVAARTAARNFQPDSNELLQELLDLAKDMINIAKARHCLKAIEVCDQITEVVKQINGKIPEWTAAAEARKENNAKRLAAVNKDYAAAKKFEPVSPEIDALLKSIEVNVAAFNTASKAKEHGKAETHMDALEKDLAALLKLKSTHDKLKGDKKWVDDKKTAIGTDVEDAIDGWALLPETQDIQSRMSYAKSQADGAYTAPDYEKARRYWADLDGLLPQWTAKQADNDKALTDEVRDVNKAYDSFETERQTVGAMKPITPELKKLFKYYWAASKRFWAAYSGLDWTLALEAVAEYEAAAKALAAKKSDFDAALVVGKAKSAAAIAELGPISDADLKKKTATEKLDLLADLRAAGQPEDAAELKAYKKLQRKLYNAIEYDAEFKEADEKRRDALVDTLKKDKDVTEARGKWGKMTDEQRLAVLLKVMNAECKVYDIPPPKVRLFCQPPGDEGYFSGSTMTLNLNTHPYSGWSDYKEAVNTVIHENMHNYQAVLERRLEEGILTEDDPVYVQAMIFAANQEPGGYVDTDEKPDPDEANQKPYKTQPIEAHAWDTGDGVSEELTKIKEPERKK
ncbi:MAG: hypothetical protein AB3N15_01885 [Paracoccaceae bacterium]